MPVRDSQRGRIAPAHLRSSRAIARLFGVSRSTVAHWREAGAPISRVGKSYQASYAELWAWLKQNVFLADP